MNIKIGDKPPEEYVQRVFDKCEQGIPHFGAIADMATLKANFAESCLPLDIELYRLEHYENFLESRRLLMAAKIKDYYFGL